MVDRTKKLTELPATTTISNSDIFIVVGNTSGNAQTRKITINNFRSALPPVVVGIANTSCTGVVIVANNLTVNASGHLSLSSNITINDRLSVTGETYLTGNVFLGIAPEDNASELIHFYGTIFSNVIPHTANNYQLGNTVNYWSQVHTGSVRFSDSTVQNTAFQKVNAPTTASSNGTTGQIAFDSNYIYYCVATNTWKRAALTTWS
jgi:hypothetical protein